MPHASRRQILAASAGLLAAGAAIADAATMPASTPQPSTAGDFGGARHPDAELIALCVEHLRGLAAVREPDCDAENPAHAEVWGAYYATCDAITVKSLPIPTPISRPMLTPHHVQPGAY